MGEHDDVPLPRARTLLRGEVTGGRLAVVELHEVAGQEPPRHVHANEDEVICLLDGDLTVCIGETTQRVAPGDCLFLPRGVEHGYAVTTATARLLVVLAPAGLEGFLEEAVGSLGADGIERMIALAARYGIALTGPTPAPGGDRATE